MTTFEEVVHRIMNNNVILEKNNAILVITDESTKSLAVCFYEALEEEGWNTAIVVMSDRTKSGEEPPTNVAEQMLEYDLVFCLTKHSLTHTIARRKASEKGISVITMPGINKDMFLNGAINADYCRVERETVEVANKLTEATSLVIHTGKQCELHIPLGERKGIASTGVFRQKGASGNLPSGEAFIAPVEYSAEGTIEINGSIAGIGLVYEPTILTIKKGRLDNATGPIGDKVLHMLGEDSGRLLAELGIGTNYNARVTGHILEDEKAYNTIHVAFGSNHTFGGNIYANVHIDCVTKNPKLKWQM